MDWSAFLGAWQSEVRFLISLMPEERYSSDERQRLAHIELVNSPADVSEIEAAECLARSAFSDEHRAFYLASNGWLQYGFDSLDLQVLPAAAVRPLANAEKDYFRDVAAYFSGDIYGSDRRFFDQSSLSNAILLTEECNDGCYIGSKDSSGNWKYGVVLFHGKPTLFNSFGELMMSEKERCLTNLRSLL